MKPIKHFTALYYYPTICKQTFNVFILYGFPLVSHSYHIVFGNKNNKTLLQEGEVDCLELWLAAWLRQVVCVDLSALRKNVMSSSLTERERESLRTDRFSLL